MRSEVLPAVSNRYHRGLYRFAVLLSCCIFVLIIAGALVTSEDAGLSVPHVAIGALLLATSFVLEEQVRRHVTQESAAVPERSAARKALSA